MDDVSQKSGRQLVDFLLQQSSFEEKKKQTQRILVDCYPYPEKLADVLELLVDSDRFQTYELRAVFNQIVADYCALNSSGAEEQKVDALTKGIEITLAKIMAKKSRLARGFEEEDKKLRYVLAN
ncbi:unnamed protein product, partial [Amoebophrya sp. A120]|eukprot:GSA120T00003873001.1